MGECVHRTVVDIPAQENELSDQELDKHIEDLLPLQQWRPLRNSTPCTNTTYNKEQA